MLLVKYADPGPSGFEDDGNEPNKPDVFSLSPAYPNPSRGTATISFALPYGCEVDLSVYDIKGRRVATPVNDTLTAGEHEVSVSGLSPGIYLYELIAGDNEATRKMVVK